MSANTFGWLLIGAFLAALWVTSALLIPRLTRAGLWVALAAAGAALVAAVSGLVWLT